jgi:hypothetical protein
VVPIVEEEKNSPSPAGGAGRSELIHRGISFAQITPGLGNQPGFLARIEKVSGIIPS